MEGVFMQERRRYIRIPEESQISYRVLPMTKSKNFLTKNICQGGIRFRVHEFIPKDKLLEIRLTIDKIPFSFEAIGKVRWISQEAGIERYEIGAEFVNIPKRALDHLIDYIKLVLKK